MSLLNLYFLETANELGLDRIMIALKKKYLSASFKDTMTHPAAMSFAATTGCHPIFRHGIWNINAVVDVRISTHVVSTMGGDRVTQRLAVFDTTELHYI